MRSLHHTLKSLLAITLLSSLVILSLPAFADNSDVVDKINITVPESCTMSGAGQDSHVAEINNGTYTPNIGTTIMHVFCNDNTGFAIYATGYTGDTIGETNSDKLVGTSASGNATIETGLATTAGNPDASNWAMKLAITQDSGDTTGANAFIIDSAPNVENGEAASFSQYHVVPNEYTKVAHKISATDMTASTGGAKLTTTYAAYISKTQPADTYTGQVKYTLVHPHSASVPKPRVTKTVNVTYGNNEYLFFDQEKTQTENVVTYSADCEVENTTFDIVKTSNISNSGTKSGGYSEEDADKVFVYPGADSIRVDVTYGLTADTGSIYIDGGNDYYDIGSEENNLSGAESYTIEGDTLKIGYYIWDAENLVNNYDYGVYITIHPLDENNEEMPIEIYSDCNWETTNGTYSTPLYGSTPTISFGGWDYNYYYYTFSDEEEVLLFIESSFRKLNNNIRINAIIVD